MKFEWNPKKAVINLKKHDISFQEATTGFNDSLSVPFPDPDHFVGESRYVQIVQTENGVGVVCDAILS